MMFAVSDFRGDALQAVTVARNEVVKFLRSRKFVLFGALVAAMLVLTTVLPYLLGATLFASYTIVSEFEERTALILFTRPIRRSTVFVGKFVACFVLTGAVMVAYYIVAVAVALAVTGGLVTSFLPSLAMCLAYVFATTGVAMLISSVMKKGGTAAILTFVTILLLISVVSAVISASGTDPWFMLDTASNAVTNSIPEYVESSNAMMGELGQELGVPVDGSMIEVADCVKSGAVMIAWGVATLALSYIAFSRREF